MLTSSPELSYTDYNLPFVLHTEGSVKGLGAVLTPSPGQSGAGDSLCKLAVGKNERNLSNYSSFKLLI